MNFNKFFSLSTTQKHIHPSVFMFLFLPFGVLGGYVSVTIAFLYTKAGIPLVQVAPLIAMTLLPNILKFIWAPLVDTTLTVKKWYLISNIITAIGILLMGILPIRVEYLTLMTVIIFITSFANTFLAMATESLMAHNTPDNLKGRAGGWSQAGNLGGAGLGGGAGLWLAERLPAAWIAGAVIAIACLFCSLGLIFLSEPISTIRVKSYVKTIGNVSRDIWTVVKSRMGFLALLLCFLPIGSGAASNLWSSISKDWRASADTVALVIGLLSGVLSAFGCLVGGWICDRMDRKKGYILFGVLQATCAVGMAFSPRTEQMFIIWTSLYAMSTGLIYAGFSAFTLEAIGKGAAATKYNVFASLSNAPLYYMLFVDEWAHDKWSAYGMLNIEAIMAVIGMTLFITTFVSVNKMKPLLIPST
jgi:MFS transporter, PAT family, beta-lactamase induction signal transducer AmpG